MSDASDKRKAWLDARRNGIGGSDAAAVVGLSPWVTPIEVYLDKTGELPDRDETDDMRRGTLLEPVVRQLYADATGMSVSQPDHIITNARLPFALANLDGVSDCGRRLLECKTARNRLGWGEPGSADIPLVYLCQVQHCMAVAELDVADVAVLFGDGFAFEIFEVPADAEFQTLLMEQEGLFWELVKSRTPPEPTSPEGVRLRWPKSVHTICVEASEADREVAVLLAQVKDHIASCETYQEHAEAWLKSRIGDCDALTYGDDVIATWRNTKGRAKFDSKRFADDHPEMYEQYTIPGVGGRQFLLKGKAKCLTTGTHSPTIKAATLPPLPSLAQD